MFSGKDPLPPFEGRPAARGVQVAGRDGAAFPEVHDQEIRAVTDGDPPSRLSDPPGRAIARGGEKDGEREVARAYASEK